MKINNVGYNHCHDADFFIDRPDGSGDYLLILLKSKAIFNINGKDIIAPENSVFIYPKGRPQYYRCLPQHTFENDWIHFDFSGDKQEDIFLSEGLVFETPLKMDIHFLGYCVKMISYELNSNHLYREQSMQNYISLMLIKIKEYAEQGELMAFGNQYEMLSTIRRKIYAEPYVNRTIEYASHEIHMSKSTFQHEYRKQFGVSFIDDLINSRISYAKTLLSSTGLSIEEIAKQCGYRTYAHFSRQFKKKTGVTPSEFKNLNGINN